MARVAALVPDLLFGSKVKALLEAGEHEVGVCSGEQQFRDALATGTDVAVVDLASDLVDGVALIAELASSGDLEGVKTLAAYSHVDVETKARADQAGFDLVVPRSRFVREGAELVDGLLSRR